MPAVALEAWPKRTLASADVKPHAGQPGSKRASVWRRRFAADFCLAAAAAALAKHCRRLAQRLAPEGCVAEAGSLPKERHTCSMAWWSSQPCETPCLTAQQSAPISLLADMVMSALMVEHEEAHGVRLLVEQIRIENDDTWCCQAQISQPRIENVAHASAPECPAGDQQFSIAPQSRRETTSAPESLSGLASFPTRFTSIGERGKRLSRLTDRLSATTTPQIARPRRMIQLRQVPLGNLGKGHKCGTSD